MWKPETHRWIRPDTGGEWTAAGVRIPPGWSDVTTYSDPDSPIQATGKDSKGRTQYLYSPDHVKQAAVEKFQRMKRFDKALPRLRRQVKRDLPEREEALLLHLIDQTGFRVGSERETGAAKQAYGATTLQSRHVKVKGDTVSFSFTGKKGVAIEKTVTDRTLARALAARKRGKNPSDRLFDADPGSLRSYLREVTGGDDFKVKDFRTWRGTKLAERLVKERPVPTTKKELQASRKEVAEQVAEDLGNTPSVSLSSYIQPEVFARWEAATAREGKTSKSDSDFNVFRDVQYEDSNETRDNTMKQRTPINEGDLRSIVRRSLYGGWDVAKLQHVGDVAMRLWSNLHKAEEDAELGSADSSSDMTSLPSVPNQELAPSSQRAYDMLNQVSQLLRTVLEKPDVAQQLSREERERLKLIESWLRSEPEEDDEEESEEPEETQDAGDVTPQVGGNGTLARMVKALAKELDTPISVKMLIHGPRGVLVLKDAYSDRWDLPGGHVQEGETPWRALLREVKEETGLNLQEHADEARALGVHMLHLDSVRPVLFYECRVEQALPMLSEEHVGYQWANDRELSRIDLGAFKGVLLSKAELQPSGEEMAVMRPAQEAYGSGSTELAPYEEDEEEKGVGTGDALTSPRLEASRQKLLKDHATAPGRVTKEEAQYRQATDEEQTRGEQCGGCVFFQYDLLDRHETGPGSDQHTCEVVEGGIHFKGWCKLWRPSISREDQGDAAREGYREDDEGRYMGLNNREDELLGDHPSDYVSPGTRTMSLLQVIKGTDRLISGEEPEHQTHAASEAPAVPGRQEDDKTMDSHLDHPSPTVVDKVGSGSEGVASPPRQLEPEEVGREEGETVPAVEKEGDGGGDGAGTIGQAGTPLTSGGTHTPVGGSGRRKEERTRVIFRKSQKLSKMEKSLAGRTYLLSQGDAGERLRELNTNSVHCCVTSPPYWDPTGERGGLSKERTPEEFAANLTEILRPLQKSLVSHGSLWLILGDGRARPEQQVPETVLKGLTDDGWLHQGTYYWEKDGGADRVFHLTKQRSFYTAPMFALPKTLAKAQGEQHAGAGFMSFPVSLATKVIKATCPPNGVVIDPFVGTGTTIIAALGHGCRGIGIDSSESELQVANRRLAVVDALSASTKLKKAVEEDPQAHDLKVVKGYTGKSHDGRFVVAGYASPVMVDLEGHQISRDALAKDLPRFMADGGQYANVNIMHSNVTVGRIIPEVTDSDGNVHKTRVDDRGLFVVAEIRTDDAAPAVCQQVIQDVLDGKLRSFSISGNAANPTFTCSGDRCFYSIDDLQLYEVTLAMAPGTRVCVQGGKKRIEEVIPGDLVVTHKNHRYRPVTNTRQVAYEGEIFRVTLEDGRLLELSPEHRVRVWRSGHGAWVYPSDLKEGDEVVEGTPNRRGQTGDVWKTTVVERYGSTDSLPNRRGGIKTAEGRQKQLAAVTSPEFKSMRKERQLQLWQDPEYRTRMEETLARTRERCWSNEEFRERWFKAINGSSRFVRGRLSGAEALMQDLLATTELGDWRYTGGGGFQVAGKFPDFWDGQQKVLEVYGDYWHRGEDPQERVDLFKGHGYDCMVVWESELKHDPKGVLSRVAEFTWGG